MRTWSGGSPGIRSPGRCVPTSSPSPRLRRPWPPTSPGGATSCPCGVPCCSALRTYARGQRRWRRRWGGLPSVLVEVDPGPASEDALLARLRAGDPPLIARAEHGRVVLDLRTVPPEQDELVAAALRHALGPDPGTDGGGQWRT